MVEYINKRICFEGEGGQGRKGEGGSHLFPRSPANLSESIGKLGTDTDDALKPVSSVSVKAPNR
jgi:hypothetical protein